MPSFEWFSTQDLSPLFWGLWLFVLPGLGLLTLLPAYKSLSWGEQMGLAGGLSVALYPLLLLWAYVARLTPGPLLAWIPGGVGGVLWLWAWKRELIGFNLRAGWQFVQSKERAADLALLIVAAALFATRMAVARDLNAPFWGDSVHHTFIVQLLMDHGGLFQSWAPYAPIESMTYHFGFHGAAAVWGWLGGLTAPRAVLGAGQFLNVLAVFALYPLAIRLGGSRWAGVIALLVAGLWMPLPAFYLNWGRYTQLAAQVILPVILWFLDGWWHDEKHLPRSRLLLMTILLSGMVLTHYRIALLTAAGVITWSLCSLWQLRGNLARWWRPTLALALVGGLALLLIVPWMQIVQAGRMPAFFSDMAVANNSDYNWGDLAFWRSTATYFPDPYWWLAAVAALLAIYLRPSLFFPLALWAGLCFLATNPFLLGLPGTGWITNFALIIALYIPIGLVVGWLGGQVGQELLRLPWGGALLTGLILLLSGWGMAQQRGIVDPFFRMVMPADEEALAWIAQNTPEDAYFLVNGFTIFLDEVVVGSDAGWWLPLYTQRRGSALPAAYVTERLRPDTKRDSFQKLTRAVIASQGDPPRLQEALCHFGVTHLYIGERRGGAGYDQTELLPQPWLAALPALQLIHTKSLTQVWAFDRSVCPN